jgi:hypothetical protein
MPSSSGLAQVHERLDHPARAVDLEVGAGEGELLAVGRMMDEAVAPADPEIELVDHQLEVGTHQRAQMLGLDVEPEDQLRWRVHDLPERNQLLIGRAGGLPVDGRVGAVGEAVHRDRRQQDQRAASHDTTR